MLGYPIIKVKAHQRFPPNYLGWLILAKLTLSATVHYAYQFIKINYYKRKVKLILDSI